MDRPRGVDACTVSIFLVVDHRRWAGRPDVNTRRTGRLCRGCPAILASVDGFGLARSASMTDEASHPAMLAAAVGLAHQLVAMGGGDQLRQLVVDHDGGLLLVWPVGDQRVLAVLASSTVDQRGARSFVRADSRRSPEPSHELPHVQDPRHRTVRGRQDLDDPVGLADPGDLDRRRHQR
jgi:predicted regulator of Ras-like GTPase activity (Roadblock/LC7/MglB family)